MICIVMEVLGKTLHSKNQTRHVQIWNNYEHCVVIGITNKIRQVC